MRTAAVGVVLGWWFSQLHLEGALMWMRSTGLAQQIAIGVSLLLGIVLALRLRLGGRTQPLAWPVLLGLAGAALWLMIAPQRLGVPSRYSEPMRAYVEWALSWALAVGTLWMVLRVTPFDEPVLGDKAPTLRLALAVGVMLAACTALWMTPWSNDDGLGTLSRAALRAQGSVRETEAGAALRWFVALLPYAAGAALVWGARLGPRILSYAQGLTRINIYLVGWGVAQVLVFYAASRYQSAYQSGEADFGVFRVMVGALFVAPFVPLVNAVLMWAVFLMLFTLGRAAPDAEPRAEDTPARPSRPAPAASQVPREVSSVALEIKRLLGERQAEQALARYADEQSRVPDFDPGTSAVVPLTKQALRQGRADLALHLLGVYGKRRPADTSTPLYRWLMGQSLIAGGRRPEGLAQLQALLLSHPEDPLAREARSFLSRPAA